MNNSFKVDKEINVLSFGAGVQSTTLALLGEQEKHGIPKFDFAVFADTGAEPDSVYECLERIKDHVSFPVIKYMVQDGLLKHILSSVESQTRVASIPAFTPGKKKEYGMLRRMCTREFKLDAITQAIRSTLGYGYRRQVKHLVNMYIGISRDEMQRMTTPLTKWMTNRYPLVEMKWHRSDCEKFLKTNWSYNVGKSACTFCPYHSNEMWKEMKNNDKKSWHQAVMVDEAIRGGIRGTNKPLFLHRSLTPLAEIDWEDLIENNHEKDFGFLDECEGICGL